MNQNQPKTVNVNLTDEDLLVCTKCGVTRFVQVFQVAKVSPLFTGTSKPGILPMNPAFACVQCGGHLDKDSKTLGELKKDENQLQLFKEPLKNS